MSNYKNLYFTLLLIIGIIALGIGPSKSIVKNKPIVEQRAPIGNTIKIRSIVISERKSISGWKSSDTLYFKSPSDSFYLDSVYYSDSVVLSK